MSGAIRTFLVAALALSTLTRSASGAKILALMVVASHSHHLWNSKYLEALVERGHQVTYFTVDDYKNPPKNLRHIKIEGVYEALYEEIDFNSVSKVGAYETTVLYYEFEEKHSAFCVKSSAFERLNRIIREEKFDLIVYDFTVSPFFLGSVDVLGGPPIVGITAFGVPTWTLETLGNPMAYSSKPHFLTSYSDRMTFLQRANNFFFHLHSFAVRWSFMKNQNDYAKKSFGKEIRPLEQILDDINIILVNSNPAFDFSFPMVPGLIPIGGLHIKEPKPLPQELQTFLDEATNGVVYFSLGSNVKSSLLKKEKIDVLLKAFEQISPVRVLWKWEPGILEKRPENVRTEKWLPQNDVLAHPNVRVFFTHSGLLSTQESVYHGKPMVGMPFFFDQHVNVQKCVERGFGQKLDFDSLAVNSTVAALKKVLEEPRYAENVQKASALFRDQIENPMDRAIYWTEYAIRHNGAPHLRYSARNLSWYQNWMIDVAFLALTILFLTIISIYKLITLVSTHAIFRNGANEKVKLKQK